MVDSSPVSLGEREGILEQPYDAERDDHVWCLTVGRVGASSLNYRYPKLAAVNEGKNSSAYGYRYTR